MEREGRMGSARGARTVAAGAGPGRTRSVGAGGRAVGRLALGLAAGALLAARPAEAQVPWESARWTVRAAEHRVEEHRGREALYLERGTAWLDDAAFRDGVIEFDLAVSDAQGFHGLRFRAEDAGNHEYVYLRPHLSGLPDAVQYNPIFGGVSAWQLYADPRYVLPVEIPADRWVRVRVAIEGPRMELRVDGGEPLVFPDLVRTPVAGPIGLTSSGAAARFANVVVRPGADPGFVGGGGAEPVAAESGVVERWRVSDPFPEAEVDGAVELPEAVRRARGWREVGTDTRGIVNLARWAVRTPEENTVLAAVTLRSDRARTVPVQVGFSDRVRVFLDGRALFAAGDEYASRDYRFLGTVGLYDTVFLPLEAGDNELVLAVSETFGGWGVTLRIPEGSGVEPVG